jgi:hypothetical protein
MLPSAKHTLLGLLLAAAVVSCAAAQLPVPCAAFQRDAIGSWNATEPLTVDTGIGLVDVMPGHPVNMRVARILDTRCR